MEARWAEAEAEVRLAEAEAYLVGERWNASLWEGAEAVPVAAAGHPQP